MIFQPLGFPPKECLPQSQLLKNTHWRRTFQGPCDHGLPCEASIVIPLLRGPRIAIATGSWSLCCAFGNPKVANGTAWWNGENHDAGRASWKADVLMMVRYVTHFYGFCGSSYTSDFVFAVVVVVAVGLCLCSTMRCTSMYLSMGMQHLYTARSSTDMWEESVIGVFESKSVSMI